LQYVVAFEEMHEEVIVQAGPDSPRGISPHPEAAWRSKGNSTLSWLGCSN
jgi:hypothetical protein